MLFIVGQTRIHIDSVNNLGEEDLNIIIIHGCTVYITHMYMQHMLGAGDFLELEVMMKDGQSLSEGQSIATDLMTKLGVEEKDLITVAYMDMLLKKCTI